MSGKKPQEESVWAAAAMATAMVPVSGEEMVRLEDGSYLREVGRAWPWERLAVQMSWPRIPMDVASASQVLDKMAAMRAEDLDKFLVENISLKDITGQQDPGKPMRLRAARMSSADELFEALVPRAMDKLESLVLEGLKIQMIASPATEPATVTAADWRRDDEAAAGKGRMVHVVLLQVRDPKERYRAIGDTMVGLIEASLQRKDAALKLEMQGLHVAGIRFVNTKPSDVAGIWFVNRKPSDDGRWVMWSVSLRQCKGPHGGDGCRCACVRNQDRVFQR